MCVAPVSISAAENETITIYFQNNWLWTDVNLYCWGSSIETSAWPGSAMELAGNDGTYDIYSAQVPADITGIVINGTTKDTGGTDQTPDIIEGWYDGICYYMKWDNVNQVGSDDISAFLPEQSTEPEQPTEPEVPENPEQPAENYTVYYVDYADNFETAYAYAWTGDTYDTPWPGKEMTPTGEVMSDGGIVYSCTFSTLYENINFNNGDGEQTADLEFVADKYLWWGDELWYDSLADIESDMNPEEPSAETMRIYFQNNVLWPNVNLYCWGSSTETSAWPGSAMELAGNDGTYDIYYCDVPTDITGIVINGSNDDGSSVDQTVDIVEGWYDGICYYLGDNGYVGSEDISVILPEEPKADIAGYSISLDGNIGVNVFFDLSENVLADDTAVVRFGVPNTGETTTLDVPMTQCEWDETTGFYKFTCYVAAKEMTSTITAQVISSVIESEVAEYTVKDYAEYMLGNSDDYAAEQELVKSLLNYGAAAQVYFNYNTDNLANDTALMTDADRNIPVYDVSYFAPKVEGGNDTTYFYGATLSLESETTLKLYFALGDIPEGVDKVGLTVNGLPGAIVEKNGDFYELKIENIAAHMLSTTYKVETGAVTVEYSALSYAYLAQQSSNANLVNVANALVAYSNAVGVYGSE